MELSPLSYASLLEMLQRWKARSTSHARGHEWLPKAKVEQRALPVVDVTSLPDLLRMSGANGEDIRAGLRISGKLCECRIS
jgi:monoamine oxidase